MKKEALSIFVSLGYMALALGIYNNYVVPDTGNAQKALRDAIQAAETEEEAR